MSLGTAAALAVGATAIAAKLVCIVALLRSDIGRERVAAEAGPASFATWMAPDLLLALGWGVVAALGVGWIRKRTVAHLLLGIAQLMLALLVAGAALVYVKFGVPPTWGLIGNLGDLGLSDARDSVRALVVGAPLAIFAACVLLMVVGAPLLDHVFMRRPRVVGGVAIGLLAATAALAATRALSRPSALQLDKNGAAEFLASALLPRRPVVTIRGDLREVLRPLEPAAPPNPSASAAYDAISRWARERPRNVVLAILESLPAGQVQIGGGPEANTPHLMRLARNGVLWPRHYAHSPNSMFAIYALLGANHGLPGGAAISRTRPRIACRVLSEVLVERGFAAGLWHSGRFAYYDKSRFLAGRGFDPMHDAVTMPGAVGQEKTSWGIREEPTIDALLAWARSRPPSQPWLAVYISVYPHHPYDVPKGIPHVGGGRRAKFRSAARYIDGMAARLADGLRDMGASEDTLLVVLGDHGEGFGEHPGSTLHGTTLYDEGTRTFALWHAPGALDAPAVDSRPFGHVDVVPTVLDLLGIAVPAEHAGTPAARAERPMVPLYTGHGVDLIGFVDGHLKFVHRESTGVSELYDLAADPPERRSMAAVAPERVEAYEARARAFVAARAAWEAKMGDLTGEGPRGRTPSRIERWSIDPPSCERAAADFALDGRVLRPARPGFLVATCTRPNPGPGQVEGLRARGHEAVNGSRIWISLQWHAPDGTRRELAYCEMNGNSAQPSHGCEAVLIDGRTSFGAGGTLVTELRYDLKGRPQPSDRFSIAAVDAAFAQEPAIHPARGDHDGRSR